jgi:predicted nucleic acid-binding protein
MKLSNVIVITDDKKARKTCEKLKINALGTLGLVELLKKHKIISRKEALALIQKIPNTSLYITPQLLEKAQHKIETQKL